MSESLPAWRLTEAEIKEETEKWEKYWFQRSKTGYPIETVKAGLVLRAARKARRVTAEELLDYIIVQIPMAYSIKSELAVRCKKWIDKECPQDPQSSSGSQSSERPQSL